MNGIQQNPGLLPEQLIPGEYYHCKDERDSIEFVFIFKENSPAVSYSNTSRIFGLDPDRVITSKSIVDTQTDGTLNINGYLGENKEFWITERGCRLANAEERFWLDVSISTGSYVTKDGALSTRQIYGVQNIADKISKDDNKQLSEITDKWEKAGFPIGTSLADKILPVTPMDFPTGEGLKIEKDPGLIAPLFETISIPLTASLFSFTLDLKPIGPIEPWYAIAGTHQDKSTYVRITGLEDQADPRVIMNYADVYEFVDFSRIDGNPIFKIKDVDIMVEKRWETVFDEIRELGGSIETLSKHKILDHLPLKHHA